MVNRIEFFADLLNKRGAEVGAEVGVANMYFSGPLLDRWPGKLYLIDAWGPTREGQEHIPQVEQDRRYAAVSELCIERYYHRAFPIRMSSAEAAGGGAFKILDNSMDFVYLDADHSYEGVSEDLRLWWPKVKSGGVLAGHDLLEGFVGGVEYGVKLAVNEFAAAKGLKVNVVDEPWPSWYVEKP